MDASGTHLRDITPHTRDSVEITPDWGARAVP
jgi:hypothetical protein